MTNKDAIKWLENLKNDIGNPHYECLWHYAQAIDEICALLKELEAKYGYWINPTSQDCHCSECDEQPVHEPGESIPLYDYCPYCGAKMEVHWNEPTTYK